MATDGIAGVPELLEQLHEQRIGVAWIGDASSVDPLDATGPIMLPADVSDERLHGTIAALSHSRPAFLSLDRQLADMQLLGEHLRRYFTDLEHDLTLAARLQRDFLPREMPMVGPFQFATLYRPCNWVSGDMLDVFQIDRHRVAFYLIDAMGHGVAAALLTMFIRNAIRPRAADRGDAAWLAPGDVLTRLNDVLAAERLPDCQFLTGWYGVVDDRTMELRYASAGHPAALRCDAAGTIEELGPTGALLGVFNNQSFAVRTVKLAEGDRLLLFTDGLEDAFRQSPGPAADSSVATALSNVRGGSARQLIESLAHQLDHLPGAFSSHADDVSVVAIDVHAPPAGQPA